MIKRKNLTTGTEYSNSLAEKGFVGSRIEGDNRVSTIKIDVPVELTSSDTCTPCGPLFSSITYKVSVNKDLSPTEYTVALVKAKAYIDQEITALGLEDLAAGPIEWDINDIANA